MKYWYGVASSSEEFEFYSFMLSAIERRLQGPVPNLGQLATRDLERLYRAVFGSDAVEDWKASPRVDDRIEEWGLWNDGR